MSWRRRARDGRPSHARGRSGSLRGFLGTRRGRVHRGAGEDRHVHPHFFPVRQPGENGTSGRRHGDRQSRIQHPPREAAVETRHPGRLVRQSAGLGMAQVQYPAHREVLPQTHRDFPVRNRSLGRIRPGDPFRRASAHRDHPRAHRSVAEARPESCADPARQPRQRDVAPAGAVPENRTDPPSAASRIAFHDLPAAREDLSGRAEGIGRFHAETS